MTDNAAFYLIEEVQEELARRNRPHGVTDAVLRKCLTALESLQAQLAASCTYNPETCACIPLIHCCESCYNRRLRLPEPPQAQSLDKEET